MTLQELLWACRRWWRVVLLTTAASLTLAWATAPNHAAEAAAARRDVTYRSTATVLASASQRPNLDQMALLATVGSVPAQTRAHLHLRGGTGGGALPGNSNKTTQKRTVTLGSTQVVVQVDKSAGALVLAATDHNRSKSPAAAADLSKTLVSFLQQQSSDSYNAQLAQLDHQRLQLQQETDTLQGQWFDAVFKKQPNADALKADYDAHVKQLGDIEQRVLEAESRGPSAAPAAVLGVSNPQKIIASSKLSATRSRTGRLAIGFLVGLVIGVGLAALLERRSEAILGVHSVEAATNLPVITEVPFVRLPQRRRRDVFSFVMPESRVAEAYRGLRTSVSLMWMANSGGSGEEKNSPDVPSVLMIASPAPSEGKSTTVANLAACYAEVGKTVIAIDLDTRRQKLHRLLGAESEPYLENIGTPTDPRVDLDGIIQDTIIPRVKLINSSSRDTSPGDILIAARAAVLEARKRADVVILDTPPLLFTNTAYSLIGVTDAFVLLVRDGKTKRTAAERSTQMLRRLDAPVLGVALIASMSGRRGYPYSYGYAYGYGTYSGESYGFRSIFRRNKSARGRDKVRSQEQS